MENEGKIIVSLVAIVFGLLIGGMLVGMSLKNKCVALVKDKPAIEIQAICK
jgi:hypothetical protein